MGSEYKLRIEASYPKTENELLTQCELHEFFEEIPRFHGVESEIINGKEYIYWEGETSGSYAWINEIVKRVRESLRKQIFDMSDEQQTEKQLEQLRVKCYIIDLESWDEIKGDKEL